MARTSQTARPRYTRPIPDSMVTSIEDHNGEEVRIAWCPKPYLDEPEQFPPFPYQVLVLDSAKECASDPEFPSSSAKWIEKCGGISDENCNYRSELYSRTFSNMLECVSHQRIEVSHRNRNGIWPRLIGKWTTNRQEGHKGFILIIDHVDWMTHGIVSVQFDPIDYDWPGPDWMDKCHLSLVSAQRYIKPKSLKDHLTRLFTDAGHSWTQEDLQRRNDGGHSPAFVPCCRPIFTL